MRTRMAVAGAALVVMMVAACGTNEPDTAAPAPGATAGSSATIATGDVTGSPDADPSGEEQDITGRTWVLQALLTGGERWEVPPEVEATFTVFPDGRMTGSNGCNGMGGTAVIDGDRLLLPDQHQTLIGCSGAAAQVELRFNQVLAGGDLTWSVTDGRLTLQSGDRAAEFRDEDLRFGGTTEFDGDRHGEPTHN